MFLLRIILVLSLMALVPALLVHMLYLRKQSKKILWKRTLWLATMIEIIGLAYFVGIAFVAGSACWPWRLFFCAFLGISGAELSVSLGSVLARCFKNKILWRRSALWLGAILASLNIIMVAMAFIIGNKRIDVTEYTYSCSNLPEAFDGFRIVHISDLHLGTYGTDTSRVAELIDKTLEQKGDMIVFTGDLVNFESKEALPFVKQLSRLKAPYGVYSIFGNHDYGVYRNFATKSEQVEDIQKLVDIETQCGWHVLRNDNSLVRKGEDSIAVVGVENDGKPPFPRLANLGKAFSGLPATDDKGNTLVKVLLTHDPSHWRRNVLGETDAHLTLSGHTHGMQFKLGKWSPASLVYKEWGGQYFEGPRSLIVSIGLGLGAVPFRYGAWSEVCVITLKRQR